MYNLTDSIVAPNYTTFVTSPVTIKTKYPSVDVYTTFSESPIYYNSYASPPSILKNDLSTFIKSTEAPISLALPLPSWLDMNQSMKVKENVVSFYYYKTLDKWLLKDDEMLDLLNYLHIVHGHVELIKSLKNYKDTEVENNTQEEINKKIKYIENHVLTMHDIQKVLDKYVMETGTNWWDLSRHSLYIKKIIKHMLKHKFRKMIEK